MSREKSAFADPDEPEDDCELGSDEDDGIGADKGGGVLAGY